MSSTPEISSRKRTIDHLPTTPSSSGDGKRTKWRRPNAIWNDAEISVLIDHLHIARDNGQTCDNGYKQIVWNELAEKLNDPAKIPRACQTKYSSLKKDYLQLKFLHESSEFRWDPVNMLPLAEERVWEVLALRHPDKTRWRTKKFSHFNAMVTLLGDTIERGRHGSLMLDESVDSRDPFEPAHSYPKPRDSERKLSDTAGVNCGILSPRLQLSLQPPSSPDLSPSPQMSMGRVRPSVRNLRLMESMGECLIVASRALSNESKVLKDTVDSTIEGQAFKRLEEEDCLTDEGIFAMHDIFKVPLMARSYLSFSSEKRRLAWLKRELLKASFDLGRCFIERDRSE